MNLENIQDINLCRCEFPAANILKEFFQFASAKNSSRITFSDQEISAENSDIVIQGKRKGKVATGVNEEKGLNTHYRSIYYRASEIELTWNPEIPVQERSITVLYDYSIVIKQLSRCTQKTQASLTLSKRVIEDSPDIYALTFGDGNSDNEGGGVVYVTRVEPEVIYNPTGLSDPTNEKILPTKHFISIPVLYLSYLNKLFVKKEIIKINLFQDSELGNGIEFSGNSSTKSFGEVSERKVATFYLPVQSFIHIGHTNITKYSYLHIYWEKDKYLKFHLIASSFGEIYYFLYPGVIETS